ncbi:hypothetical protein [Anatilimnocola floriformis]|uniref:hypothetical protein n=1 Tax=Anatilimnocola floriformis TaxID=2948575 RepID=UPI0020C26915|nr:hypothetical protein [Anatilimnocola floriformis]
MSDLERYGKEKQQCVAARNEYLELVQKLEMQVKALLVVDEVQITDNRMVGMDSRSDSKCTMEAREWPTIDKIITSLRRFNDARKKQRGTYEALEKSVRAGAERPL